MKQRTLQSTVTIEGVGLHTGKTARMAIHPAPADHGFRFQRSDLEGQPIIPADANRVVSTNRGTTLKQGEAQVHTIEHVLSALAGLEVDNALLVLDGPEVPIMDGSARLFVEAIQAAGTVAQDAERDYLDITEPISYKDPVTGSEIMALPSDGFEVTAMIDFNSPVLGQQYASLKSLADYASEIAPCRTFVFLHELEVLLSQNLIKGGSLDNAIVIADRVMDEAALAQLAAQLGRPSVKVESEGVLNTLKLHFKNEPARHKLLDIVGDLALVGAPIKGRIMATKPGHTSNVEFAKILKKLYREQRKQRNVPKYDPNATPVYDVCDIMRKLPHRFPFLFVDKVMELSDSHILGVKNVTHNEAFFQGHFPDNPVMPGVLQIEAMAQVGGIFALAKTPDDEQWDTYFLKINEAKFKHKVVPGDTLLIRLELVNPIRRGIVHMQGAAYVGTKIVSEAEMTAQVVKRT